MGAFRSAGKMCCYNSPGTLLVLVLLVHLLQVLPCEI